MRPLKTRSNIWCTQPNKNPKTSEKSGLCVFVLYMIFRPRTSLMRWLFWGELRWENSCGGWPRQSRLGCRKQEGPSVNMAEAQLSSWRIAPASRLTHRAASNKTKHTLPAQQHNRLQKKKREGEKKDTAGYVRSALPWWAPRRPLRHSRVFPSSVFAASLFLFCSMVPVFVLLLCSCVWLQNNDKCRHLFIHHYNSSQG